MRPIDADALIAEYDRVHVGAPGGARKLMQDAPTIELPTQPEIVRCNSCKHWTQTIGEMRGFGLGICDFHNAEYVTCNGFCYWAERREE